MIQHIFKLIWKKRKSNFLIMLEIFVAFLILFAISSLGTFFYRNYIQASGIEDKNVWAVNVNFNSTNDSLNKINRELVRQKIKSFHEIEMFSFCSPNFPYSNVTYGKAYNLKGKSENSHVFYVDEMYASVLGIKLQSGNWFKNTDTLNKRKPVVISQTLKEKLFGDDEAVGKNIGDEQSNQIVVGVISDFKNNGDFYPTPSCGFEPMGYAEPHFIARVNPSVSADFEAKFASSLQQLGNGWIIEINHLDQMRSQKNDLNVFLPLTIAFIVCGFLIINVAFGLFGVLFQNITRRKGEIGVRRAMGATANSIKVQFIGEMLVLATFSITLGLFFAMQFPLLNIFDVATSVYIWGILLAIMAVYGIVILCAWFPSRQAATIQPAVALHNE